MKTGIRTISLIIAMIMFINLGLMQFCNTSKLQRKEFML